MSAVMSSCRKAAAVFWVCVVFAAFAACNSKATAQNASGRIAIRADDKGFTPSSINVTKGSHAVLVFTRTTEDTCARDVVFPELKLKKPLPLNQPVEVDVPTGSARTLAFTCGMGMFNSSVVIQ
jgi:plastocyanin domain-containing protein